MSMIDTNRRVIYLNHNCPIMRDTDGKYWIKWQPVNSSLPSYQLCDKEGKPLMWKLVHI